MAQGLDELGTVVDVVRDGALLVESPPRDGPVGEDALGAEAVDQRHETVGTVADVIGPVNQPFFLLDTDDPSRRGRVVGKEVYASLTRRGDR